MQGAASFLAERTPRPLILLRQGGLEPRSLRLGQEVEAAARPSAATLQAISDRIGRVTVLIFGLFLLLLADGVLASASSVGGLTAGVLLWGLHMGFAQGLLAALIADTPPPELRGTAVGMFNLVSGLAQLCASVVAGALWDALGPQSTFLAGAGFVILTLAGLLPVRRRLGGASTTARA